MNGGEKRNIHRKLSGGFEASESFLARPEAKWLKNADKTPEGLSIIEAVCYNM